MPPLRVAVVGAGAFGRNHLRVYSELAQAHPEMVELAALVETDGARRAALAAEFQVPGFATVGEIIEDGIDAASVCVPTVHHAAVAEQLLRAGVDVLIEKPLAATLAEAERVVALAREHGRVLAVGHLERFNPAVTATLAVLNRPMFFEAHRLSIFTPRSLDVDVVLDLMVHDLDIVLALAGSAVREVRAVGLPVLSAKTDIANVRVEFESGCVANFTASRVSTEQVRKLRLFQPHQYLSLDFARQELLTISVDAGAAGGLTLSKSEIAKAEPLRLELLDFLQAVRTLSQPRVTGEAGMAALALALEINRAIAEHAERAGLR
jgi:predicted dehydrogenase